MRIMLAALLVVATGSLTSTSAPIPALRPAGPSLFHPYSRTSPDGTWSVLVDPTQRYGDGPADYVVKHADAVVWSGRRSWTLRDAAIDDAGRVAGYGYSEQEPPATLPGALHAVLLAADGSIVLDERHERARSREMHGTPWPFGLGVHVQPELERFVFWVACTTGERGSDAWWAFSACDGSEVFRKPVATSSIERAGPWTSRAVRGTPLTCVRQREWTARGERIRCILLDSAMAPVWRSEVLDGAGSEERVRDAAERAFGVDPEVGHFSIVLAGEGATVRFVVERAGEGWSAREIGRTPWSPPEPRRTLPAFADLPTTELVSRGVVPLEGPPRESPAVRDVRAFDVSEAGVLRFVRTEQDGGYALVRVDVEGKLLSEKRVELAGSAAELEPRFWPLAAGAWLVTQSPFGTGARSSAWRVDESTGVARRLETFDAPAVDAVAAFAGGGFVVLATESTEHTRSDCLIGFDSAGIRLWRLDPERDSVAPASLFSASDVAITSDGRVAVIDTIREILQYFSATDGRHIESIDLAAAWERKPNYVADIAADVEGGVLVHDFGGDAPLVRVHRDGTLRAGWMPRGVDGKDQPALARNARVAPDGRVWSADAQRIVRLGEDGTVDLVAGVRPDDRVLAEPSGGIVDVHGRAVVADAATGVIHVHDSAGRRLFTCAADSSEVKRVDAFVGLCATRDGGIAVQGSRRSHVRRFGPGGEPLAPLRVPGSTYSLAASPAGDELYAATLGDGFARVATEARPELAFDRAPDRSWLRWTGVPTVGRDGTVAITGSAGLDAAGHALLLYAGGDPGAVRVVPLPEGAPIQSTSLGRGWAVVWRFTNEALLVELAGERRVRIRMTGSGKDDAGWQFGFDPETGELLALDVRGRALHRFALPQ